MFETRLYTLVDRGKANWDSHFSDTAGMYYVDRLASEEWVLHSRSFLEYLIVSCVTERIRRERSDGNKEIATFVEASTNRRLVGPDRLLRMIEKKCRSSLYSEMRTRQVI